MLRVEPKTVGNSDGHTSAVGAASQVNENDEKKVLSGRQEPNDCPSSTSLDFEQKMALAEEIMDSDRDVLGALAK